MESKKARKQISRVFYTYPKVFKEIVCSTVEWAESNMAVDYSKVAVQTSPSNHKETQLCALMDNNLKKARWCNVVEKVLEHYKFEKDKVRFIDLHWFKKKTETEICIDIGIGRMTFYRWQNEIIDFALNWAKEYELIKEQK